MGLAAANKHGEAGFEFCVIAQISKPADFRFWERGGWRARREAKPECRAVLFGRPRSGWPKSCQHERSEYWQGSCILAKRNEVHGSGRATSAAGKGSGRVGYSRLCAAGAEKSRHDRDLDRRGAGQSPAR